jgi:hypothetical protein
MIIKKGTINILNSSKESDIKSRNNRENEKKMMTMSLRDLGKMNSKELGKVNLKDSKKIRQK